MKWIRPPTSGQGISRVPPWRWSLWGPWPAEATKRYRQFPTVEAISKRATQLAETRPWCKAEENWLDAEKELYSPFLLRWRPSFLRWLGASDKTGWDWVELSLKFSVPLTLAILGMLLGRINDDRQRLIADNIQKDAVLREYIKEMTGLFADKETSRTSMDEDARKLVLARAVTAIALEQLGQNNDSEIVPGVGGNRRMTAVFRLLREMRLTALEKAELRGYNLAGADMWRAKLRGVNLYSADLRKAGFIEADLGGATLAFANLSDSHLGKTNLRNSDLTGADMRRASFTSWKYGHSDHDSDNASNLDGANFTNAMLNQADLRNVDLRKIRSMAHADLEGIRWDETTKWPSRDAFQKVRNIPSALKKRLALE